MAWFYCTVTFQVILLIQTLRRCDQSIRKYLVRRFCVVWTTVVCGPDCLCLLNSLKLWWEPHSKVNSRIENIDSTINALHNMFLCYDQVQTAWFKGHTSLPYFPIWCGPYSLIVLTIKILFGFHRMFSALNRLLMNCQMNWNLFRWDSSIINCPTYFDNPLTSKYVPHSTSIKWFQTVHFHGYIKDNFRTLI